MSKKIKSFIIRFALTLVILVLFVVILLFERHLSTAWLQFLLNQNTKSITENSIRIQSGYFDRYLKLHLETLSTDVKSGDAKLPITIKSIESTDSVFKIFSAEGLQLRFLDAKFQDSTYEGLDGMISAAINPEEHYEVQADVRGLGFGEIVWLSPEYLAGSSGNLTGRFVLNASKTHDLQVELELDVREPGGVLPARFFELLLPYIPYQDTKARLKKLVEARGFVGYRSIHLIGGLSGGNQLKLSLFVAIPDYNFNLNTNITVQLDERNAWFQIGQLLDLIYQKNL